MARTRSPGARLGGRGGDDGFVDLDPDVVDGDTMIDPGASAGQAPGVDVLIVSALTALTEDDVAFYGCQVSALSSPRSAPARRGTTS